MKKQYFFAHLFVRAAKGLAVLALLIGTGFCVLQYSQANNAASQISYRPSSHLQRALDKLKDAFLDTEEIISAFNKDNQATTPVVQGPRFPPVIDSSTDFSQTDRELARVDVERQKLKESIVNRFEALVKSIEEKLHVYAAALHSTPSPTPAANQNSVSVIISSPSGTSHEGSLFSSSLGTSDATERGENLSERKEFLKILGTKAESVENRTTLNEAADQLERLGKLLPEKFEARVAQSEHASTQSNEPRAEGGKVLPSERVAGQLEKLRGDVRQTLLTSWTLDETFDQAVDLNSAERDKYRQANLTQKGIWISATSRMVIGALTAALASLLVLVFADLVQTQLDTAVSGNLMADTILALRGLVRPTSPSEPPHPEA